MGKIGLTQKYCHAELVSASAQDIVHRFRNEFGMTLRNELFGQSPPVQKRFRGGPGMTREVMLILRKKSRTDEGK
ncbi:MAG TPA: hypothetical protein DCM57_02775, partial [Treponema sp.]|nr:hypothetical protein [Treponema sp.]